MFLVRLQSGECRVRVCGSAGDAKLGLGANTRIDQAAPVPIPSLDAVDVRDVVAGTDHSFALARDGRVFVWGFAQHGVAFLGPDYLQ